MILFSYGVMAAGDLKDAGWLHGLKLAAVAVVAQAVWGMGRSLCPDRARLTLAAAAAMSSCPCCGRRWCPPVGWRTMYF
jgi:chromate transporter